MEIYDTANRLAEEIRNSKQYKDLKRAKERQKTEIFIWTLHTCIYKVHKQYAPIALPWRHLAFERKLLLWHI